jgi:PKD repeat protein
MKRIFFPFLLLLIGLGLQAQNLVTVSGHVSRSSDGSPVADWPVFALNNPDDSLNAVFGNALTDINGDYVIELDGVGASTEVLVSTLSDCINGPGSIDQFVDVINWQAEADFEICFDSFPVYDCTAEILYSNTPLDPLTYSFEAVLFANDGAPAVSYLWDFGDGTTSTEANPTHTYAASGFYPVSLVIETETGCIAEGFNFIDDGSWNNDCDVWINIELDDSLGVQFSADLFSFDSTNVIVSYSWDFGDGTTSTDPNPYHIYAQDGLYVVTLTVETSNGCTSVNEILIEVGNNNPWNDCEVWIEYTQDDSLTFTFDAFLFALDSTSTILTYEWDFGDGSTSNEANPTHTYDEGGFYVVILTVTTDGDCESASGITFVVTDAPPFPDCDVFIDYIQTGNTSFDFSASTFSANGGPTGVLSYSWDFGDGTTSTDPNPSHTYADEDVYTVQLTVMTEDSCEAHACIVVIAIDCPIDTFWYDCQAMFFNDYSWADPLTVAFTDISFGAAIAWSWDFGDGNTSNEQNPTHTYAEEGIYEVTLAIETLDGCESEVTFEIWVGDNFPWIPSFDCQALFIPLPDSIGGNGIQFIDISFANGPISSWTWDFGDGNSSTEQNPYHVYSQAGIYTVSLTIEADSCSSIISFDIDTENPWNFDNAPAQLNRSGATSAAGEISLLEDVQVFPNPVQDQVNLVFTSKEASKAQVVLSDLTGRTIYNQSASIQNGLNKIQLEATDLYPGVYLIQVRAGQSLSTIKFIKQ